MSDLQHHEPNTSAQDQPAPLRHPEATDNLRDQAYINQGRGIVTKEELLRDLVEQKAKFTAMEDFDKESNIPDGNTSFFATCTTSEDNYGPLTSCVGTRWFRAPELLYGSVNYGIEVDLWSLGCIFAELFSLEPLFPGTSDIDQLARIFNVMGNLTEETYPGCSNLPDFKMISFCKVEKPTGLEACLPNCSPDEILIIKKLLCFDPANRATAMELLHDKYLNEEPLPVPISELRIPSTKCSPDEDSHGDWYDYRETGSDSDFEDFGGVNVTKTDSGFSVRFD